MSFTRSLHTPAAFTTKRVSVTRPPAVTRKPPSVFSIDVTSLLSSTRAPFFTAVSASAMASSHGLTMPAVGASRALVASRLTFGSSSCSSAAESTRSPGTPFFSPRAQSSRTSASCSSSKASTRLPIC